MLEVHDVPDQIMDRLLGRLASRGLDGFVHFQTSRARDNVVLHYLSGVQGLEDSGVVISLGSEPVLLVKDFEGDRAKNSGRIKDVRPTTTIPLDKAMVELEKVIAEKRLKGKKIAIDDSELSVEVYLRLKKMGIELVPFSDQVKDLRMIKTEQEIDKIRGAAMIASESLKELRKHLDENLTESQLGALLSLDIENRGAEKSFIHVQFEQNASFPHHISASTRVASPGFLVVDLGARVEGYNSDITRTLTVGEPDSEHNRLFRTVQQAIEEATRRVAPNAKVEDVAKAARDVIASAGFPQPEHRIGHGLGLNVHEAPITEKGFPGTLQEGMVIAIEPGVYIKGKTGCRLESDLLVTSDGVEELDTPFCPLVL